MPLSRKQLQEQADLDPLTGLHNRRAFAELADKLGDCSEPRHWLVLFDIDDFKQINDAYGHNAGDALLTSFAARLRSSSNCAAQGRLGGDEFVVIIAEHSEEEVVDKLEKLISQVTSPVEYKNDLIEFSVSAGVSELTGSCLQAALPKADFSLYSAKKARARCHLFDAVAEQAYSEEIEKKARFARADLKRELSVHYQPIYNYDRKLPVAVEALARWETADGEHLLPADFIPLAERTGRIIELTDVVLEQAFKEAGSLPDDITMQINVSSLEIGRKSFISRAEAARAKAGIAASKITFEITEGLLLRDLNEAEEMIAGLQSLGYRIALDDFGSGFSGLSYLDRLPVDQIKVDRALTARLGQEKRTSLIASTIMILVRQLEIECTIEGVETAKQARLARGLGFRNMQGFFFSHPLNAGALHALFRELDLADE